MFGRLVIRAAGQMRNTRSIGTSVALRDVKSVSTPMDVYTQKLKTPDPETVLGPKMHRCSNFDRWMLVWIKKFPSKDQVPDKVGQDLIQKAQSQARIKTTNIMMVSAIIGCIAAVIVGKREAKAGHSLYQQNIDWHNKINEEYKQQQAAAAAAANYDVIP